MTSRQVVSAAGSPRDGLASRAEVAAHLGVSPATLGRWAYRRIGPPYRIVGKHARYSWVDVDRWLEGRKRGGGAA